MKQGLRTTVAFAMAGIWLMVSLFFVVAVRLMSVDEEWRGWSDVVGIVLIYVGISALVWAGVWLLVRKRR